MRKLGVAVIGTGFWGRNHARVFSELPNTELVAVCDINREKVKSIAEKFEVEGYVKSGKMLKREDIEAVSICTWATKLAAEAKKALNAGKHVFIEKPMADSAQHAKIIVDLAEKNGRYLTVGFIERFNPGVQRVKDAIEKGEIGTLVSATAKRVSQWPERIGDVGVVKDTAIHDIDVMRHIFAQDPIAVYAKAGNLRHKKFEDYAQIMLTFEGGKTAFLEANWLTPYKIRNLSVTGSEAMIHLNYLTQEVTIETAGRSLTPRHAWEEPLKLELQNFADCILNDKKPLVTGYDGLRALEIAEAALKSAEKCRAIKFQ
jgi:UDP-N-acetylglucosamine 3-dehydrogenase